MGGDEPGDGVGDDGCGLARAGVGGRGVGAGVIHSTIGDGVTQTTAVFVGDSVVGLGGTSVAEVGKDVGRSVCQGVETGEVSDRGDAPGLLVAVEWSGRASDMTSDKGKEALASLRTRSVTTFRGSACISRQNTPVSQCLWHIPHHRPVVRYRILHTHNFYNSRARGYFG